MGNFKLRKPDFVGQENFTERTYREIIYVKDGLCECEREVTRDTLVRRGFTDITDGENVTRKNLAKKKAEKKSGKKESILDKVKKKLKG